MQSKTRKLLEKVLARHEKFGWTNFNKIRRFLLNQDEFGRSFAVYKHTKISVKFIYRPIFKRSNIGGPIYRSVSSLNLFSLIEYFMRKIWKNRAGSWEPSEDFTTDSLTLLSTRYTLFKLIHKIGVNYPFNPDEN